MGVRLGMNSPNYKWIRVYYVGSGEGAAQLEVCNTQTEPNLRFLKKICRLHNWPLLPPLIQGLVRGDEGIMPVAGPVVAPGAGNDLRGAFKARPPTQGRDFRVEAARPIKMATTVKPWAAIRVRIMSWERWL